MTEAGQEPHAERLVSHTSLTSADSDNVGTWLTKTFRTTWSCSVYHILPLWSAQPYTQSWIQTEAPAQTDRHTDTQTHRQTATATETKTYRYRERDRE